MQLAGGLAACADRFHAGRGQVIEGAFAEDGAAGVAGAKKQDVQVR
jgi:hypothetical protein